MRIHAAAAAFATLVLLTGCEPDAADTDNEVVDTAPMIDTTDSPAEQLENEAEAVRQQADKQAEAIQEQAESTAENIEKSADQAAEQLEAEAEKAR